MVTDNLQIKLHFILRILSVLANSLEPDEMLCSAAFHLGPHSSLQKYHFQVLVYKGLIETQNDIVSWMVVFVVNVQPAALTLLGC